MKYIIPITLFLLVVPIVVAAQVDFGDCDDITISVGESAGKLCELIEKIETLLYILGGGLAIIIIIVSGIMYLSSGGDQSRIDKAKKILTYGLIGAIIIFASSFIIDLLAEILGDAIY